MQSCGIITLDAATGELTSVASLDLPAARWRADPRPGGRGHHRAGRRGAAARAERGPLERPARAFPQLRAASGLRSMLAAPLRRGRPRHRRAHRAPHATCIASRAEEESLAAALRRPGGDRARARAALQLGADLLERLEAMVAERTRELDEQKRFVEVVLETLPLGRLRARRRARAWCSANREGARAAAAASPATRRRFAELVPPAKAAAVRGVPRGACSRRARCARPEEEMVVARRDAHVPAHRGAAAGPATTATHADRAGRGHHAAEALERQMLLTERLTTAGRLAAGVAHELNNPLATIAGCAEALQERARGRRASPALDACTDFPTLPRAHRGGGVPLQGDHRQPAAVRARSGQPPRADRRERAGRQDAGAALRHQSRFAESRLVTELDADAAAGDRQRGPAPPGVPRARRATRWRRWRAAGRLTVRTRRRAAARSRSSSRTRGRAFPRRSCRASSIPFFTTKPPGQGTGPRPGHRPGHRGRPRRPHRGALARRAKGDHRSAWCCRA